MSELDEVTQYIRERKRHMSGCLGVARAQLASARGAYALKPNAIHRETLVRAIANLEIAEAFTDALRTIR